MSINREFDDAIDASDLLTEDGSVDPSAVKSLDSSSRERSVTAQTCHRVRYLLAADAGPDTAEAVATVVGHGGTAARRHPRGGGRHVGTEPTHPPIRFDMPTRTWVIDE